ncbi:MAG: DoxX family membrane protein [Elusimicrobia bacterium]|nr:DoxX family membrane protein [Elusimicrobiota bacterium]
MRQVSSSPLPLQPVADLIARCLVGGVLAYAGFSKATGPVAEFAAAIDAYQIVQTSSAVALAGVLPWIELYTGVFLLFGYLTRAAARVAVFLFAVLLVVFIVSLWRGIDPASCGCFGAGVTLSVRQAIAADTVLFGLSCFLMAQPSRTLLVDAWIHKRGS